MGIHTGTSSSSETTPVVSSTSTTRQFPPSATTHKQKTIMWMQYILACGPLRRHARMLHEPLRVRLSLENEGAVMDTALQGERGAATIYLR
jgi:hypothetical protein